MAISNERQQRVRPDHRGDYFWFSKQNQQMETADWYDTIEEGGLRG
jgi:hypothetical protein